MLLLMTPVTIPAQLLAPPPSTTPAMHTIFLQEQLVGQRQSLVHLLLPLARHGQTTTVLGSVLEHGHLMVQVQILVPRPALPLSIAQATTTAPSPAPRHSTAQVTTILQVR